MVAAGHLMCAPDLWKHSDIDMLDVGARHAKGNDIFGLTGRGTGVTPNTACLVDDFRPLHAVGMTGLLLRHCAEAEYITELREVSAGFADKAAANTDEAKTVDPALNEPL